MLSRCNGNSNIFCGRNLQRRHPFFSWQRRCICTRKPKTTAPQNVFSPHPAEHSASCASLTLKVTASQTHRASFFADRRQDSEFCSGPQTGTVLRRSQCNPQRAKPKNQRQKAMFRTFPVAGSDPRRSAAGEAPGTPGSRRCV